MTRPADPPAGLGPLSAEPMSLYPPFQHRLNRWDRHPEPTERYRALLSALGDVELGSYDVRVLRWLSELDPPTVATVCALLYRVRAARHSEAGTCGG